MFAPVADTDGRIRLAWDDLKTVQPARAVLGSAAVVFDGEHRLVFWCSACDQYPILRAVEDHAPDKLTGGTVTLLW